MSSMGRQVGEFPPPIPKVNPNINPYDKSTVVSIVPHVVEQINHTIFPGRFRIGAGTFEIPATLIVGASSWFKVTRDDQPVDEFSVSSVQVAESIIKDYCNGMLGCDMDTAIPGMFFIPGRSISHIEVKIEYKNKLEEVRTKQNNWFKNLINLADSLWARSNGNPLVIWDEMRIAAKMLNETSKPWLQDFQPAEKEKCFACGNLRDPKYPVCPTCKALDPKHPLAKDVKFAG